MKDLESEDEGELIDIANEIHGAFDRVYGPDPNPEDREPVLMTQDQSKKSSNLLMVYFVFFDILFFS